MNPKYRFYIMNVMLYSMTTLYNSFIPLKLSYLSADAKGALLAVSPVVSVFAPILWGIIADRMKYRKRLLSMLCIFSAIFFMSIILNTSYLLLFPIIFFYSLFSSGHGSLSDTLTFGYCSKNNVAYGRIRLMGTLGYGLFAALSGPLVDASPYSLPILYAMLATGVFFVINALPEEPRLKASNSQAKPRVNLWKSIGQILKIPNLPLILFFVFCTHYPLTYFYSFYSEYFIRVSDNPEWYWGLLVLATVIGEVPLLIYFDKLSNRFSPKFIFTLAGILTIVRYGLLMFLQNVWLIVIVSLVTGYVTTMIFYTATRYLSEHVPNDRKATGQSVLYSATGLSALTANLLGGVIANYFGIIEGIVFSILLVIVAVVCMQVFYRSKPVSA